MSAIDGWLEGLLHGEVGVGVILLVSMLLGLRHASDPDHLAAVTTLIASEEERHQVRKAGIMGFLWGLGHGTTLVLIGLPLVLLNQNLPEIVGKIAEFAIGCIIVLLAMMLLVRWRRGLYHVHVHTHEGGEAHRHVHSHVQDESHGHPHKVPKRTPLSSYGVGLIHGIGGSGGLTLLLISTISDKVQATGALLLFATGTAVSMAILSTMFGLVIAGGLLARNFERVAPVLGVLSMTFGVWYALGALGVVVYPF
jgi:ABC-type nickel/cobalt efflux system permease component RcnA